MLKLISVIVVNYNGKNWLHDCLTSISRQTYKNYEIILVDNGSTDGSSSYAKKKFPEVKIVELKENLGFSGGNNAGFEVARGEFVVFLNNDTKVKSEYLENFVDSFKNNPKASVIQSKIVWMNDPKKLDTCGSYWTDSSFLYYIGNNKSSGEKIYNKSFPVFSVKGASVMVKREVIEKIGLFYNDFWSYYEETDFCHRAWTAGYECWYDPRAVCYHAIGGTSLTFKNDFIQYHNFKNKLASMFYNFEVTRLLFVLPVFFAANLLISVLWIAQGKLGHSLSLFKALLWNISNFDRALRRRKKVQQGRKVGDSDYLNLVRKNPRVSYFYHLFRDKLENYQD